MSDVAWAEGKAKLNSSDRQNSTSASALSCACHSVERAKTRLVPNKCESNRLARSAV